MFATWINLFTYKNFTSNQNFFLEFKLNAKAKLVLFYILH